MTVKEIIEKVGTLRRNNQFTIEDKMRWLNQCEAKIQLECLLIPCVEVQYKYEADAEEKLIAQPPFDELYIYYICAKIDEALCEMEKYNNSITQYNKAQEAFQKWLIENHDPKHNCIQLVRDVPVITVGDEVEISIYGLPVKAGDITEAKALLKQGDTVTEVTEVTAEEDILSFQLTSEQSGALTEGSLYVGYEVTSGEKTYRNDSAQRLHVQAAPKQQVTVRSVDDENN